jgi:hypothetical protein
MIAAASFPIPAAGMFEEGLQGKLGDKPLSQALTKKEKEALSMKMEPSETLEHSMKFVTLDAKEIAGVMDAQNSY